MSKGLEALKRIRQETCPATYCQDFDKEECCNIIEKELEVLEIIKDKIIYRQALCDRTKNPDNDLVCFEIRGLVDKETWLKIYEVLKGPVL